MALLQKYTPLSKMYFPVSLRENIHIHLHVNAKVCSIKQFEKFAIKNCNNIEINEGEGGGVFLPTNRTHGTFFQGTFRSLEKLMPARNHVRITRSRENLT